MSADRPAMKPFGDLASWDDAVAIARAMVAPIGRTERVPLRDASGRILAGDIESPVDVPAAERSAMDGYAIRAEDSRSDRPLRRLGRIAAGHQPSGRVEPGSCIEIATGAPLPEGADAVAPVEITRRDGDAVRILEPLELGAHVSARGEDVRRGEVVVEAGRELGAATIAALATIGETSVRVLERPSVLVAPTGDEIVPLGEELQPGQVYESNSVAIETLVADSGGAPHGAGIQVDRVEVLRETMTRPGHDLTITIGGTSVGRRDLVVEALRADGEILLHGVAVKPGKPLLLGRAGDRPLIGLPGFPTTCLMLGYALVAPLVRRLAGRPEPAARVAARLDRSVRSPAGKVQLLPVALENGSARPTFRASSAITSVAAGHGWVRIDADVEILEAGSRVEVHPF